VARAAVERGQRRAAVFRQFHLGALAFEDAFGYLAVDVAVVDHQDAQPGKPRFGLGLQGDAAQFAAPALGFQHRVVQAGTGDRLGQDDVHGFAAGEVHQLLAVVRGDHDKDGRVGVAEFVADFLRGAEAVHARHAPVQQHDVIALALHQFARLDGGFDGLYRQFAGLHRFHPPAQAGGGVGEHGAGGGLVVGDEDVLLEHLRHGVARRVAQPEREFEGEHTADARRSAHPQDPAHQFHQPAADGEAQAGTAQTTGGRGIGLAEGLEDGFLFVLRDADAGVADFKAQPRGLGCFIPDEQADRHHHFAGLGEFDGICPPG
jgi:hypothetical protein